MYPKHRIAIEPRSGRWFLFYETLKSSRDGIYKQQLLYGCKNKESAEKDANIEKIIRYIEPDVIIRDDAERNVMLRQA